MNLIVTAAKIASDMAGPAPRPAPPRPLFPARDPDADRLAAALALICALDLTRLLCDYNRATPLDQTWVRDVTRAYDAAKAGLGRSTVTTFPAAAGTPASAATVRTQRPRVGAERDVPAAPQQRPAHPAT
jgi:hypothetical protein